MRTIKFRGKNKKDGKWFIGNLYDKDIYGRTHICTINRGCLDIDPDTVGQFTGLHDKNGREIYEGDILKGALDTIFQVFYDDCYFGFRAKEKGGMENCIDYYGLERIEVIGNIHDNTELLKQQENK